MYEFATSQICQISSTHCNSILGWGEKTKKKQNFVVHIVIVDTHKSATNIQKEQRNKFDKKEKEKNK